MKHNWARLMVEKSYLVASTLLTICSVVAAIALMNNVQIKGNIALITDTAGNKEEVSRFTENKYFNITTLKKQPPKSDLLFHRYDAIVSYKNGAYTIDTIKGDDYKTLLLSALKNPASFVPDLSKERKIGTNIIGYMMMFLLMQGVLYARLFGEDKEKHRIERVVMSPIAFSGYLLGHGLFIMLLIIIPSFAVVAAARIAGAAIGFTLVQYILLISLLAFLSTAFALFLNSLFCETDTPNMIGSSVIVLTSILAGSFYSFAKSSSLFNKILHILPQKDFILFADALEKKKLTGNTGLELIYILALSVLFFAVACIKTHRDYVYHK
jgi:ABC-2 type transport system permease protein